jgi:methyl-accepting chemotaxis protein
MLMQWFNRLKVRTRFILIGLFILPFLAGLGGAGVWGIVQVNAIAQGLQQNQLQSEQDFTRIVEYVQATRIYNRQANFETDPTKVAENIALARQSQAQARQFWDEYLRLPSDPEERALWPQFEAAWQSFAAENEEAQRLALLNTSEAKQKSFETLTHGHGEALATITAQLADADFQTGVAEAANSQTTFVTVLVITIGCAIGVVLITLGAGVVLARSIIQLTDHLTRLHQEVSQALTSLETKRQAGEEFSHKLKSRTRELSATSHQQASGSQQQSTALQEVVTSLSELTSTAQNIAVSASRIEQVVEEVGYSTQAVKEITLAVAASGEQGQQAVQKTIGTNQQLSEFYEGLVQLLGELYEQSGQIKAVIELMRQMSDETHLLALNAAIEAAGAGEQGERFGVVAAAVKELADRSVRASQEVSVILNQLRERIQSAVTTAGQGQEESGQAVAVAEETGQVIGKLVKAIAHNAQEVTRIEEAMQSLKMLTEQISFATSQQSSASSQTVAVLQEVGIIAQQNASGSQQVSVTVQELEELSLELNLALAA